MSFPTSSTTQQLERQIYAMEINSTGIEAQSPLDDCIIHTIQESIRLQSPRPQTINYSHGPSSMPMISYNNDYTSTTDDTASDNSRKYPLD
ncbi:hypothetical protein G6F46_009007 [Rhizopus delemar]|nr:hypothetical protein G6F36_013713 [Rhizopus arrhizus]KAG1457033.1 hypothetical protein G6F55_006160 [Rhizopus delemar]KAG1493563.1 hypothetical protein G6F54_008484 [Rhizopus delemar]KAG1507636.1 hypothetical protein G6F53_008797 [Rhizopus delemar]KAG1523257.1 hypothetical protein G6F52_005168 [Rhizopus delemar]